MSQQQKINVLLIEDNPDEILLIDKIFHQGSSEVSYHLESADGLAPGLSSLAQEKPDAILLDLGLPDSEGLDTFHKIQGAAPKTPVVILTVLTDEKTAVQAVKEGAQDYLFKEALFKGSINGGSLVRAIRYAIERKSLEDQLLQAQKMESVGRLAASVAHEVKNPLATILMGIHYLSKVYAHADKSTVKVLKDMQHATESADSIVKGMLEFSAFKELELKGEDLNALVEQTLSLMKHTFEKSHISVVTSLDEKIPKIRMDRNKIEQVFVNLFTNAIDAMPKDGTLTVKTYVKELTQIGHRTGRRRTDRFMLGETVAVVEIEDTGAGIPEDQLSKVFDPFFTTKPTGKGTGLGLAVTEKIIDLHLAAIDIKNRKEGGVVVTIRFKI